MNNDIGDRNDGGFGIALLIGDTITDILRSFHSFFFLGGDFLVNSASH